VFKTLSTAAIGRNVGHTCSTLTVQTELLPFPHPRPYRGGGGLSHPHPVNLLRRFRHRRPCFATVVALIADRFRVTVLQEAHRYEMAGSIGTLAHLDDRTRIRARILCLCRGISNKGQYGRAENSSRNNKFRSRFDAEEPAHLESPLVSSVPVNHAVPPRFDHIITFARGERDTLHVASLAGKERRRCAVNWLDVGLLLRSAFPNPIEV